MKRITLFLTLLALMTAVIGGASARTVEQGTDLSDLTALAAYAPDGTSVFAAIRTDDGYFDTFDAVIGNIAAALGTTAQDLIGVESVSVLFNDGLGPDVNFDVAVRPWLGDTAALYIPAVENLLFGGGGDQPFIFAFSVVDQDLADAFVQSAIGDLLQTEAITRTEEDGVILYEPALRFQPAFVITEDALLYGVLGNNFADVVLPGAEVPSLAQSEAFDLTLNTLPRTDYNIAAYVDLTNLLDLVGSFLPLLVGPETGITLPPELLEPGVISDAIGRFALGAVIISDRALVLDISTTGSAFTSINAPAVDLALLERVPASAGLLVQGSGLGDIGRAAIESIGLLEALIASTDPEALRDIEPFRLSDAATFVRLSFEGTFGVEFNTAMNALNSDFVTYLTFDVNEQTSEASVGVNAILRSRDADVTDVIVERVAGIFTDIFNPATFEDGVLNVPFGALVYDPAALSFSIATDGDLILVGDSGDVAFMGGETDGAATLTDLTVYGFESSLFLPGTTSVWLVNFPPFATVSAAMTEMLSGEDAMNAAMAGMALSVFDSASITTAPTDGGTAIRLTLTFAGIE